MTFQDRFTRPLEGHALVGLEPASGVSWCLRCGALWLDIRPGLRAASSWEAPSQTGRSQSSAAAPPCLPSTEAGAPNAVGDSHLMLSALTHGWRCEPVLMPTRETVEAWRWSREGLLGGEAWSVVGAWADGPVINETVRRMILTASEGPASAPSKRGG